MFGIRLINNRLIPNISVFSHFFKMQKCTEFKK